MRGSEKVRGLFSSLLERVPAIRRSLRAGMEELDRLTASLAARERELQEVRAAKDREIQQIREHARSVEDGLRRLDEVFRSANYNADSLMVFNKNVSFLRNEAFMQAYRAGVHSGHKMGRKSGIGEDIHIEWRVHVACWAAARARHLEGSFVECGVNTGIPSLAVCRWIDFNATGKDFYLFDTFRGIPEEQMAAQERQQRIRENDEIYEECYDLVRRNFAPFPRGHLVRGMVPDTLRTVNIEKVCYLSIDMNIAEPEIAAMEYFWDKLVPGATVILDDYGWAGYELQQKEHDRFAASKRVPILLLPTGQGLIIKP
jgi:hypothetical protein